MRFKAFSTAIAALSLIAVPTVATAAKIATPLTQTAAESNDNRGGRKTGAVLIAVLAVAAVAAGIVAAAKGDDKPNSP